MDLAQHKHVQSIAKCVHDELGMHITAESTEAEIAEKCIQLLAGHGIRETWYHDVPAFVLLGSRSCLSISGREYLPR